MVTRSSESCLKSSKRADASISCAARARLELLEAALWYKDEDGVALAREFGDAYRQQLARARTLPRTGHPVSQLPADLDLDVRSFLLARFPYTLFIAAVPAEVVVVAVAHQHRRPFYWSGRLNEMNL